jgi:acetoin utilization protein AcuB
MSAPNTIGEKMTRSIHSIGSDQPLAQAHRIMRANGIRHLPVLAAGKLVGIVSNRDLYWLETLTEVDTEKALVEEAMTPLPYAVAPETPLAEVVREMAERKYGAAVVIAEGEVVGLFTTTDALHVLAEALAPTPRRLQKPKRTRAVAEPRSGTATRSGARPS